jgi:hypothetical protein
VAQLVDEDSVALKMLDCGKRLRDEFKANVILLGCAAWRGTGKFWKTRLRFR